MSEAQKKTPKIECKACKQEFLGTVREDGCCPLCGCPVNGSSLQPKLRVKARSVVGKAFLRTVLYALGLALLNFVLFLVFGNCKLTVSVASLSIIAFGFRLLNFLPIAFLALFNREVVLADEEKAQDQKKPQHSEQSH